MKISWQQLHRLPVHTESGQKLGVVEGVTVDVDSHAIVHYEVKPGMVILGLFSRNLLIAPSEVVSITAEKMVVKDAVAPAKVRTNKKRTRLALATPEADVEMSEID